MSAFAAIRHRPPGEPPVMPTTHRVSRYWKFGLAVVLALASSQSRASTMPPPAVPPPGPPPLTAPQGVTAVSGRVVTLDGTPLANVAIRDDRKSARTDEAGRFLLTGIDGGGSVLSIDGRHAGPNATADYGYYEIHVDATAGKTTVLPFTSWLPLIAHEDEVPVSSPTTSEVVLRTPKIPDLEIHIPPGTMITDVDGKPAKAISITPVPLDRTPFPLPANVYVPLWFTVQPGGAVLSGSGGNWPGGAQVYYPNFRNDLPGAKGTFWRYDPDTFGWKVYGTGRISADRQHMVPDPGTRIYEFSGFMFDGDPDGAPPDGGPTPPQAGSPPGGPPGGNPGSGGPPGVGGPPESPPDGEPVDLATGLYVQSQTDLALNDMIPLKLTRTYRPNDFNQRSFGVGMTNIYEMYLWSANQYQQVDFVTPDGGRVHYVRTSSGTGWTDAVFTSTVPGPFFNSQVSWNGNGWNLQLTDGTLYVFGSEAPLQYIQDRFGNRVTLTRGGGITGNILQVTSTNGRSISFTYDSSNRITQAQDNIGRTVSYAYDSDGQLQTVTDPNGGVTTYSWDSNHRVSSITDANSHLIVSNAYDSNGRVETQTLANGGTYRFAYTLAGGGNVTETDVTDPLSNIRKVTFNSSQYWLTDKRAYGTAQEQDFSIIRDSATNLGLSLTDALGRVTTWVYNSTGKITSITLLYGTSNALTTGYTYDPVYGQLLTVTDPLSNITTLTRNSLAQVTEIADPLGHTTSFTYNTAGQVLTITDPLSDPTQFAYNYGDLSSVTDPLGRATTPFTDIIGRLAAVTDPLGNQVDWIYDPIDGVHQFTDPDGATTTITYNAVGKVATITDPRGGTTGFRYDTSNRLSVRTDPLTHTDQYTSYDNDGNLLTATDRKGQVVTYTYDALNRLATASYADGSSVTYTWDAGNRLTEIDDSVGGTITRTYDGLNHLTSETTPQGTVSYTYDADGHPATMSVPGQPNVVYTFDTAGRLTLIAQGSATVSIGYDAANRRTSVTLPNGVVTAYSYDAASELTGITYSNGSTTLGTLTYAHDLAGRIVDRGGTLFQSVLPAAVTSGSYDANNRLTAWVTPVGGQNPTYDYNGDLTSDGTNTYTWDARKRLTAIGSLASFVYDGFGRRQSTTIGSATISYLYNRADIVEEQSGGSTLASLLTGLGIDERFTRTEGSIASTYLTDNLGSIAALADSSGTIRTSYGYDPYGNTTSAGSANDNTYQYTGREHDGTGLYFNRARYYNPSWTRFISEDPIRLRGGDNLYAYVAGNPISLRDPHGTYGVATTSPDPITGTPDWFSPPPSSSPSASTQSCLQQEAGLGNFLRTCAFYIQCLLTGETPPVIRPEPPTPITRPGPAPPPPPPPE
jgi:RHS repeat-associated protein